MRLRADARLVRAIDQFGARVHLKPVEYVRLYGPPAARCTGCSHATPDEHDAGGRLDRMVLEAVASCADFDGDTWGMGAWPAVPTIAEEIGYCDRSVQYSLRRLVASGFLELVPVPGTTNMCRILRPVEPFASVDTGPEVVDNVGDNRPPDDAEGVQRLHRRGAMVAPNQVHLPTDQPPPPPDRVRKSNGDGADAPAHAPPRAARSVAPASSTADPSRTAAVGAQPHRRMRGAGVGAEPAPPSYDDVAAALSAPLTAESAPRRVSRLVAVRTRRCRRCSASPGDPCRTRDGRPRKSVHAERRMPDVYGPAARAGLWRPPRSPDEPVF